MFYEFAKRELDIIKQNCKEPDEIEMQEKINEQILDLVKVFENEFNSQGHSGFTANYVINIFYRILKRKPLTPLTGEEWEWTQDEIDKRLGLEHNIRYSKVYRKVGDNSTAYDSEGKIFSPNGGRSWYRCKDSRVPIKFPYKVPLQPKKVILDTDPEEGLEVCNEKLKRVLFLLTIFNENEELPPPVKDTLNSLVYDDSYKIETLDDLIDALETELSYAMD